MKKKIIATSVINNPYSQDPKNCQQSLYYQAYYNPCCHPCCHAIASDFTLVPESVCL
jgi:hypothetical protein